MLKKFQNDLQSIGYNLFNKCFYIPKEKEKAKHTFELLNKSKRTSITILRFYFQTSRIYFADLAKYCIRYTIVVKIGQKENIYYYKRIFLMLSDTISCLKTSLNQEKVRCKLISSEKMKYCLLDLSLDRLSLSDLPGAISSKFRIPVRIQYCFVI